MRHRRLAAGRRVAISRGNETTSRVWRVRGADCAETRERTVPGSSLPERAELVRGREVSRRSSTGVETTTEYDALGRVASVTDGAGNTTVCGYDVLGRRVSETDPNGLVTTTAYDAEGRVVSRRGATYPVDYEYDGFGDRVAMATYRDAALAQGDVTLWLRDEATGLVTNKVYADGAGPTYAYTPDGKLALRTWARGVSTSYAYDGAGNLVSTAYSDGTPSIACAYDRSGNIVSAVTEGVATNFYAYCEEGLVTNEVQNGATLARSYDSLGRPAGYTLRASATPREVSFSYDLLGRLFTVASGTNLFTYAYLLGTDLVSGYTCGGFSRTVAYEPYRDLVSAITNRFGNRVISTFEYTNDAAGRRTAIKRGGDAMEPLSGSTDAYGYNGRNEVVSARRTLGGESVAGFDEDFAYDPIGNRISATDYDETGAARTSTYTANNLNQYTARTVPGWASVRGLAVADATVAVNGNLAYALASGDLAYFFGSDDFDNSAGGGFAELEVSAAMSDATNDFVSVVTNRVFIPPANETYAYDADGNQTLVTTGTGAWQVEYNGENRPVRWTRISPDSPTPNSSTPTLISMAFDHQGRRRLYVEIVAGVTNKLHRFTYDDYICIARNREIDAQHGVGLDAFVWDPTEPIATRPLMCDLSDGGTLLYCHDGNKNVSETVSLYGSIAAHYEYSSFGKVVMVTSENEDQSMANLNPYRFSSEYADDATRLVYYNYRHYDAGAGRWLIRDWIDESSMINLYGFCWNDADFFDWIGLLINWYHLDDKVVNDLTKAKLKELCETREVLGQTGIDDLGNVTTDVVGMNVICECKDGQWKFQGASVSLQNTIHMREAGYSDGKTGPSRKWVLDREKEHANDAREWSQRQRNDKRWDDFSVKQDGMSYPSKEECQNKVSSALRDALNDALLKEAEASRDKWDKSGKHTWKSREGTRKELMSW